MSKGWPTRRATRRTKLSGFFDAEKVREETLEKILETDLLLFQGTWTRRWERLRGAAFPPRTKTAFTALLNELDADIERVETRLVARTRSSATAENPPSRADIPIGASGHFRAHSQRLQSPPWPMARRQA